MSNHLVTMLPVMNFPCSQDLITKAEAKILEYEKEMMEAGQDYQQLMSLTEHKIAEENVVTSLMQEWEELENIMMEVNAAQP